jgi:hypothetical protein
MLIKILKNNKNQNKIEIKKIKTKSNKKKNWKDTLKLCMAMHINRVGERKDKKSCRNQTRKMLVRSVVQQWRGCPED